MITDTQLVLIANVLGVTVMVLVVAFHYVTSLGSKSASA
jgi:hypothetical protein